MGLFTLALSAQDLRIHVNQKGKVGFVDASGNEVIKCSYESAQPFVDGIAIVTKSDKSGIIDATGKVLVPLKYKQITPWGNGLYLLNAGKKVGLAAHNGTILLEAKYSQIGKLNCYGKALLAQGGKVTKVDKKSYLLNAKYGIIDADGRILVQPTYKGLYEFSFAGAQSTAMHEGWGLHSGLHYLGDTLVTDCSYLGVSGNGFTEQNCGIINGTGNVVLQPKLYSYVMLPKGDMVRYYNLKKNSTTCGYHNLSTGQNFTVGTYDQKLVDIKFWTHGGFIGDIAPVNGSSWSFIDKSGRTLRTGYTSLIHSEATGLWAAKNTQNTWDVFDDQNHDVAALSGFEEINFPLTADDKVLFCVKRGGKFGVIDRAGNTVVPFEYESMTRNHYDCIGVKKNGKWGIIDTEGKVMVPLSFEDFLLPAERGTVDFWMKKADGLYYHYNVTRKSLAKTGYKAVTNFKEGFALAQPANLTLQDNSVTRAQCFAPNASAEQLSGVKLEDMLGSFGHIVNTNDEVVIGLPVSTLYADAVRVWLKKAQGHTLSEAVQRRILLHVTRENRSYGLKTVLGEEEWDY